MAGQLFTIGYEGRSPENLLAQLRENDIQLLLDVRIRPNSRKPGFSKNALSQLCGANGIAYTHDPELGTPPDLLEHAKQGAGYDEEASAAYRTYLISKTDSLATNALKVSANRACLLCYEADARNCHRRIVAEEIAKRTSLEIVHL